MHELTLCHNVLRIVQEHAQRANAHQIKSVRLEVGALAGVEPDALRFGFAAISRGTLAEHGALEIIRVPGCGWCAVCACEREMNAYFADCPRCGASLIYRGGGDELRIVDMEVT